MADRERRAFAGKQCKSADSSGNLASAPGIYLAVAIAIHFLFHSANDKTWKERKILGNTKSSQAELGA